MSAFASTNGHEKLYTQAEYEAAQDLAYEAGEASGHDQGFTSGIQTAIAQRVESRLRKREAPLVIRPADRTKMRPVEFVWKPWLVRGCLNLIVGQEDVGKSTLSCWIAAGITTGSLPGVFEYAPQDVLFIGADEDSWEKDTLPRLEAAGADFDHVHELGIESGFDVDNDADHLRAVLTKRKFGLIVVEHLMDVLPAMRSYTDPATMRRALKPFRRVLRAGGDTALATLHVNKSPGQSLREYTQGTVQFGAMARSSFLVAKHPKDPSRRVAVLGKANYVKDKDEATISFAIAEHVFVENGCLFEVGKVVDVEQEAITMAEALGGGRQSKRERKRSDLAEAVLEGVPSANSLGTGTLAPPGKSTHAIAEDLGRSKTDGTVRRILNELEEDGLIQRIKGQGWVRVEDEEPEL
jgi:hypothetical protein